MRVKLFSLLIVCLIIWLPNTALAQLVLSGYGTPVIDGEFASGEWRTADSLDFQVVIPTSMGGGTAPGKLYVMNDATNLYLAVSFLTAATGNSAFFSFDNDNSGGALVYGDDVLGFNPNPAAGFLDEFRPSLGSGRRDTDEGGSSDGYGAFSNSTGNTVYEFAHPLDSADDAHDFSLAVGNLVPFNLSIRLQDYDTGATYPENTGDTDLYRDTSNSKYWYWPRILISEAGVSAEPVVDQSQTAIDYGFWFDDEVRRWQEFLPGKDQLTRVEIWVRKTGSPGNLYIEITGFNLGVVATATFHETEVSSGWLIIDFPHVIPLELGAKYRINVYSDKDSSSPDDRYYWRGSNLNNYNAGTLTDVSQSWGNYDYAFITYAPPNLFQYWLWMEVKVQELYVGILGRAADRPGLDYWLDQIYAGIFTLENTRAAFTHPDQAEYTEIYGGLTSSQLVTAIYENFLERAPDMLGFLYWVSELDNGRVNADQMVNAIINAVQDPSATGEQSSKDLSCLNNKIEVAMYFTEETKEYFFDEAYREMARAVLANVTDDPETLAQAKAMIDEYVGN